MQHNRKKGTKWGSFQLLGWSMEVVTVDNSLHSILFLQKKLMLDTNELNLLRKFMKKSINEKKRWKMKPRLCANFCCFIIGEKEKKPLPCDLMWKFQFFTLLMTWIHNREVFVAAEELKISCSLSKHVQHACMPLYPFENETKITVCRWFREWRKFVNRIIFPCTWNTPPSCLIISH